MIDPMPESLRLTPSDPVDADDAERISVDAGLLWDFNAWEKEGESNA